MYWTQAKMLLLADVDEYSFENAELGKGDHLYLKFSDSIAKLPLKLGYEWVIIYHIKSLLWLFIHAIISVSVSKRLSQVQKLSPSIVVQSHKSHNASNIPQCTIL